MKYNFDEIINRQNCNSLKWDIKEGELPMWVADMDFKVCPEILEAIHKKIDVGALGYSIIPEEWYKSYISFWKERYSFDGFVLLQELFQLFLQRSEDLLMLEIILYV